MHRVLGHGSDKKIIILNANQTIAYLFAQLLDFIHDSKTVHLDMEHIVSFLGAWLYVNNYVLSSYYTFQQFVDRFRHIILSFSPRRQMKDLIDSLGGFDQLFIHHESSAVPENAIVIIDQCDAEHPASAVICDNKSKHAVFTPSVIYDNGSFSQTCGKSSPAMGDANSHAPIFSSRQFNQYSSDGRTASMYAAINLYKCPGLYYQPNDPSQAVYDHALCGYFPAPNGTHILIVLAYRACIWTVVRNNNVSQNYVSFTHRIDNKNFIKRGYSPSVKMLHALQEIISDIYKSGTLLDQLLAYNELVAKHWGDLGLVLDAVGTDRYVISNDNTVKYLCSLMNAHCIFDNRAYTARHSAPIIKFETNTSSIFDRSYWW